MKDYCKVIPLGAGREVGRSCFYVEYSRINVQGAFLLDCGINPSISESNSTSDIPALPFFDLLDDLRPIDFILISHFHTDHVGGLPALLYAQHKNAQLQHVPIYMTQETLTHTMQNFRDTIKQKKLFPQIRDPEQRDKEANDAVKLIEGQYKPISFHSTIRLAKNVAITAYAAGHVEGAAMFLINLNNYQILYTGDYSMEQDKTLRRAEIPENEHIDVLITEGTYGTLSHVDRAERERKLLDYCETTLKQKGKVLFPVFAQGRVIELLQILNDHWAVNPDLQQYKITFITQQRIKPPNPLPYVSIEPKNNIDKNQPQIVFCTPGMLQSGVSRELFEDMCDSDKNALLVTGYGSNGSLLHQVIQQYKNPNKDILKLQKSVGGMIKLRMRVLELSFSAHSDFTQICELLNKTRPDNIIFVHGSRGALGNLIKQLNLQIKLQNNELTNCLRGSQIYWPDNGESVLIDINKPIITHLNVQQTYDQFIQQHKDALYSITTKQDGLNVEIVDQMVNKTKFIVKQGLDIKTAWDVVATVLKQTFMPGSCTFETNTQVCRVSVTYFKLVCNNTNPMLFNTFVRAKIGNDEEQLRQFKQNEQYLEIKGFDSFNKKQQPLAISKAAGYIQVTADIQNNDMCKLIFKKIANFENQASMAVLDKNMIATLLDGQVQGDGVKIGGCTVVNDANFGWYVQGDDQQPGEEEEQDIVQRLQKVLQVWL